MHESVPKIMDIYERMFPKLCQNDIQNRWQIYEIWEPAISCFFAKNITLKSFFHMIRGTGNLLKINKKSMRIRCSKKWCTNQETCSKTESKWEPKSRKYWWKWRFQNTSIFYPPGAGEDGSPGTHGADLGGSLLVCFNIPTVRHWQSQTDGSKRR